VTSYQKTIVFVVLIHFVLCASEFDQSF